MSIELLEEYFEELADPKDLLFNWRKKSWERFQEIGLPHRKQEAFRYVSLQHLSFPPLAERVLEISVPPSVVCLPLDAAMRSYGIFLQNRLMQWLKEETDPFAALNGAFGKGIFLYVPPKTHLEVPLEIHLLQDQMISPRIHLYLGKGSHVKLLQKIGGAGCGNLFCDVVLDENAQFTVVDQQSLSDQAQLWSAFRAKLKRDSRLLMTCINEGSSVCRSSLKVQLAGENSEAQLRGLSRLNRERQSHIHALVEHQAPHARSHQHFKSVLDDKSSFSFEGKILVQPDAQKTESYQLSNSLLLSDEAKSYAKPNLEIFADDVKASHGATVGQLDKEALFYLRSRGLDEEKSKMLLIEGFCREILEGVFHA